MSFPMKPVHRYVAAVSIAGISVLGLLVFSSFRFTEFQSMHFWIFFTAVIVGELFPIKLPRHTESLTITASGTFTFALLITHGVGAAVLALVTAGLIDDVRHRKRWWKVSFNSSQYALSVGAGGAVLALLSPLPRADGLFEVHHLPAILVAGAVFFTVNSIVTGVGIALAEGAPIRRSLATNMGLISATDCILLALAPIVVAVADFSIWLLPLLALPMVAVYKSARVSLKNIQLADNLRSLYEATRISYGEQKLEESIRSLLSQTCDMFQAEKAKLILLPSESDSQPLESIYVVDGDFDFMRPTQLEPTRGVWARVVAEEAALLITTEGASPKLRAELEGEGITEAIVAPVRGSENVIGILEVANRVHEAASFNHEEVKLFETLANHAGVSVENADLVTKLEESLAHLTEMNRLKDDFVASVSHELRTPLTSIKGYVKTLLRPDVSFTEEQKRDFLSTVARQADRLHRMIEDLLVVSRIETAGTSAMLSWVSIPTLLEDVLSEITERMQEHPVELVLEPDLPKVETDDGKLHQIIANLVDNAMKYSDVGRPVTVEARRDGEGILLSVKDRGTGIPVEQQSQIFERFYQVDQTSTRPVGGAGLGLYICRSMAMSLDARIWLDSSDENGSVFCLWVPINYWDSKPEAAARMGAAKLS